MQLLYTHIDNLVIATSSSSADTFADIVDVSQRSYFLQHASNFFTPLDKGEGVAQPGQLKREFHVTTGQWEFASPYALFYTLINHQHQEDNVSKTASLNHLSPQVSFQCAVDLLNNQPVTVSQERRIDKLSHLKTHHVLMHLKGNK